MDMEHLDIFNNHYQVINDKGQRIIKPIHEDFDGPDYDDVRNAEVFIEFLPDDMFEMELLGILSNIGPVYQIRILMQFSGKTKGKAFVIFTKVSDAYSAVEKLNNIWVRSDHPPIKVAFSVNNKRLHLLNVPRHKTAEDLRSGLGLIGITNVKVFTPVEQATTFGNMNNAIITFQSHKLAASARRLFVSGTMQLDGQMLRAEWAKPKDSQTLFVTFEGELCDSTIRELFETGVSKISRITFKQRSIFIKYHSFEGANFIHKFYHGSEPFETNDGVKILKVDWPIRN